MTTFTIGEEVMYDDERFVIAGLSEQEPVRYRLLATSRKGVRVEWARKQDLKKLHEYHTPHDDTANY